MIDAASKVWVCEEGHVDDHHVEDGGVCLRCGGEGHEEAGPAGATYSVPCKCHGAGRETNVKCSRCGGTCEQLSLDGLAREYRELLRVNVGILAENKQLKGKLREANVRSVAEMLGAVGHHLDDALAANDLQAAVSRTDAALKLLAPFREQQGEVG